MCVENLRRDFLPMWGKKRRRGAESQQQSTLGIIT